MDGGGEFFLIFFGFLALVILVAILLGVAGLAKGGLARAIASGAFVGAGGALAMLAATQGGWLNWLAGGPTRTTRDRFILLVLAAGPLVPLVFRVVMRRLPRFREIAAGVGVVMAVVFAGNIPNANAHRSWVRTGVSTGDAAYRYDRLHNRLVVDLRRDWNYNTDARLDVYCGYARGDRPAIGASRTVMHLEGSSIELDDVVVCKVRDPRKDRYQSDFDETAFMHRLDA